ncbi:MAG: PaaI family thioesterase [Actinomycetota bacterium]
MDEGSLEAIKAMGHGALMDRMGIEWGEANKDKLIATMPVEGNTQPYGMLHGGASAVLAEGMASVGAWLNAPDKLVMGIEIKVNHLRPVTKGYVTGVAIPISVGRTVQVWQITLTNDEDKPSAFAVCTIAVREAS